MHLFLAWRAMEDPIGLLGQTIERCLWGDARARHTSLIAFTGEQSLVSIEIDIGDYNKGIRKSMKLNMTELTELPQSITHIELIGETKEPNAFEHLVRSAHIYVNEHPHYHVLSNNCRTFVEYLIDRIPEFQQTIPRRNGSILEYYHSQAKHEHPGALVKSKQLLKSIREQHRHNKVYTRTSELVLKWDLLKQNNDCQQI
jgi:hypothetical protein